MTQDVSRRLLSLRDTARAMSQENVEIARRVVAAWNRRDLEALLALSDPEGEYVNSPTAVEPGTRRGHDEVAAVFRAQWEILLDGRLEIERIYDRGDEVIVLGCFSRRLPGTDTLIDDRSLLSWKIRDGKVIRGQVLGFGATEVREALQAVGLPE